MAWVFFSKDVSKELAALAKGQNAIMSVITDWAAKEQTDLTAIKTTLEGVVTGIQALDAKIVNLQNSPGTLSPADQAALDSIESASAALVAQAEAISTAPPDPPVSAPV